MPDKRRLRASTTTEEVAGWIAIAGLTCFVAAVGIAIWTREGVRGFVPPRLAASGFALLAVGWLIAVFGAEDSGDDG